MWRTYTNLPSLGQSQFCGWKLRCNLDKDVFCLEPNRTWRQNSLGRVAPSSSLSVNFSSVLFSSSAFSISFSTSISIVCRITHHHSPSCNGMRRNTNCHCTHYTPQVGVTFIAILHVALARSGKCHFVGVLQNKWDRRQLQMYATAATDINVKFLMRRTVECWEGYNN